MSPTVELHLAAEEALVQQSSGRALPEPGAELGVELRFGPHWGGAVTVGGAYGSTDSALASVSQVGLRPGAFFTYAGGGRHFVAHFALGPTLTLVHVTWTEPEEPAYTLLLPGGRGAAGLEWLATEHVGIELGLGVTARVGGVDADLGVGVRWRP